MESVPLIPKAKVLPNLDAAPLLQELFQDEFQAVVPTKKLSQNILTSLQYQNAAGDDDKETFRSVEFLQNLTNRKDNVIDFTENVLEAYLVHEKNLDEIRNAEKHLFETQAHFLKRQATILDNTVVRDLLSLKRQPLFKALNADYVKKYKLLQGDAGLPLEYEANSDFRVKNFKKWKRMETPSQEDLVMGYLNKASGMVPAKCWRLPKKSVLPQEPKKISKPRPKNKRVKEKPVEIFRAEPKVVFFRNYKIGSVYAAEIEVKNMHTKGVQFQVKPTSPDGPFRVTLDDKSPTKVVSGLSFQLRVEFSPKSLDNVAEDIAIVTEDGYRLLIPLIAYLEPPVLKTHKDVNEYTKNIAERIASSYVECGVCFAGDIRVTKLRFRCFRGCGEFFIMSSENWNRSYVNTVTFDNLLDIPPFHVYPVYFKMEKDEVIDLFVEFKPKYCGMHVESIVIVCDNGEIRFLDLLGDAVGWHSYYFSFQDCLLKSLPAEVDDDPKVKYYLDFEDSPPTGSVEKAFCVCNNSNMAFEFQWKIREPNLHNQEKYMKLSKFEVKIDPENGTFEANSIWEFVVTITFNNAEIGSYRMVLSLYVLNLPYQCIEEDNTIIQPTGLVRNLYSQSLYGEEEGPVNSPELTSLQGTYESLQDSIKSYVDGQTRAQSFARNDFCRTTCLPNPGLCAKPLKKSKTFFNIGDSLEDEGLSCVCRMKPPEPDTNSESCTSNLRDEKTNEMSSQRNEVIWDFVDVLADEVELWVEVVPSRVTLEPAILELGSSLKVNGPTVFRNVLIVNHNRCPVTCTWLSPSEIEDRTTQTPHNPTSFSLLFDHTSGRKEKSKNSGSSPMRRANEGDSPLDGENSSPTEGDGVDNSECCRYTIKPQKTFCLRGHCSCTCEIGISARRPGTFRETLFLSMNEGDLLLKLLIMGSTEEEDFEISPEILDFGVLKQGTRCSQDFRIINPGEDSLSWKIRQFKFEFNKEGFLRISEETDGGAIKKKEGALRGEEEHAGEFCLNARVPGTKCQLLEVEAKKKKGTKLLKRHVFVLADVKQPKLQLSAPRFENAILSPAGTMYVGQKVTTTVMLTNVGAVETFFTWGHPFGCHSRKIKVDITPKSLRLEKKQKMPINVELTPLEEGIVSHCYVPCFFCRSKEPLILSIVVLAENVSVTFEIIDYPMQTHADVSSFLKTPFHHTVLRIPWPLKVYNPTLNLKYINEKDLLEMRCRCLEVEEEANRAFGERKQEAAPELAASEKSVQSLLSFEMSGEGSPVSKNSVRKFSKSGFDEDLKLSASALSAYPDSKKSEENSLMVSTIGEPASETLRFVKSELDFLGVSFRTPMSRQFVIRNETPIQSSFQINVSHYGVSKTLPCCRIEAIRDKVMGHSKDEFQDKLSREQPLVIMVEPSRGELKGFDAVCVNVVSYGNTWGEYRDSLICQVKGLEAFHMKLFVQIVGHPIHFPMFRNQPTVKPVLWFEPLTHTEEPASKQIKVVNRSAVPLSISWMVFLTKPLPQEEEPQEESFNCSFESNHSAEESSKSSKNYIPKNTSESVSTFRNPFEVSDSSQDSGGKSFEKTDSSTGNKEKRDSDVSDNKKLSVVSKWEETNSRRFPGRQDTLIFQVEPKKMEFEPLEEKKITVTFDPRFLGPETTPQEFKAVLTGCVKLKPEDENCPGTYYRPCGVNFVSELMDFNALVETPLLSFEILRGDLKFLVDSNAVVKSASKQIVTSRKFLLKNKNQKTLRVKIEIVPGVIFQVTNVNTIDKFYPKYNPDKHDLKIEPGHLLEIELQCSVSYKDVIYAFEQLKLNRMKDQCPLLPFAKPSSDDEAKPKREHEPWIHQMACSCPKRSGIRRQNLDNMGGLEINVSRISPRSECSVCDSSDKPSYSAEAEGEFLELSRAEEIPCRPKPFQNKTVIEEEMSFVQCGLVTQILVAELHLSFPALKVSPKSLDFGNVYLGETAVRYCSLINLTGELWLKPRCSTLADMEPIKFWDKHEKLWSNGCDMTLNVVLSGFPTDFKMKAKCSAGEFTASPMSGSLPPTNYNSDLGRTITVEFKPPQPGYFKEIYHVYCNSEMEFDFHELFVSGFGSWNEKYKSPKLEIHTKLEGIYPMLQK